MDKLSKALDYIARWSVYSTLAFLVIVFLGAGGVFLFFITATQAVNDVDVGENPGGIISGFKWEDINGNGILDDGEPKLDGWTIRLSNGASVVSGDGEWPDGYYEFPELENETYIVCEEIDGNRWTQTYPNDDTQSGDNYSIYSNCDEEDSDYARHGYEVEIDNNKAENLNFGNFKFGHISGHKYAYETGDPISGFRIRAIYPNGSIRRRTTNDDGRYIFPNLGPGTYRICEAIGENEDGEDTCIKGPDQASPDSYYSVEMRSDSAGLNNPHYDFTNYTEGRVEVRKFKDLNGDSQWQKEIEPPLVWNFCLFRTDPENEGGGEEISLGCKNTSAEDGLAVWTNQDLGLYRVVEEEKTGWFKTLGPEEQSFEIEENHVRHELVFGNKPTEVVVKKFHDKNGNTDFDDDEPFLPGRRFCLYQVVFSGEEDGGPINKLVPPCQETDNFGTVSWTGLTAGDYLLDEEEKEHWFHVTADDEGIFRFEFEGGVQTFYIGNNTTSITGHKYYDINKDGVQDFWAENLLEPDLRGWQFCLYRIVSPGVENGPENVLVSCQPTDEDGLATWVGLSPGSYLISEEEELVKRENWQAITESSRFIEELERGDNVKADFGNWTDDQNLPVSIFNDVRDHQVVSTELAALSLAGNSKDQESGVQEATLSVYQLGGPESVQSYPAHSFFDVFAELRCFSEERPIPSPIPIELVSLSLVSVDPITVNWNHDWRPPSSGIYCFKVKAKDYAGNQEQTATAGPLAYVPVTRISEETKKNVDTTSLVVEWITDKPATSRVIYDTVPHPTLGEAPNYGYAFSTVKQDIEPKVINHSVIVGELRPGTTYYYRIISAASPEAVGPEQSVNTSQQSAGGGDSGGSVSSTPTPTPAPAPTPTPTPNFTPTPTPDVSSSPSSQVAGATTVVQAVQPEMKILPKTGTSDSLKLVLVFFTLIAMAGAFLVLAGYEILPRKMLKKLRRLI